MKLEEAIKEMRQHNNFIRDAGYPKLAKAQQLGIEALKRELEWRRRWPHQSHLLFPFPGETEDEEQQKMELV